MIGRLSPVLRPSDPRRAAAQPRDRASWERMRIPRLRRAVAGTRELGGNEPRVTGLSRAELTSSCTQGPWVRHVSKRQRGAIMPEWSTTTDSDDKPRMSIGQRLGAVGMFLVVVVGVGLAVKQCVGDYKPEPKVHRAG